MADVARAMAHMQEARTSHVGPGRYHRWVDAEDVVTAALGSTPPHDPVEAERVAAAVEARLFGSTDVKRTFGRYEVHHRLGVGGTGIVHAAYDPELDRKVAIKLLRPSKGNDSRSNAARARLLREAQAIARLDHPNVAQVHELAEHEGVPCSAHALDGERTLAEAQGVRSSWRS